MSRPDHNTRPLQSGFYHRGHARHVTSDDWLALVEKEGFSAAIFDCDGTLVHSMEAHLRSMQTAAREQGQDMTEEWYGARTGLDRRSLFREFRETVTTPFDVDRAIQVSIESFAKFAHLIEPIPPVLRFATALKEQDVPIAVATNAERYVAEVSLSATGASVLFDHVVSISDDVQPKPSPEMFELAAELLGTPRNQVLVVEDSPQGIQAAKDAGMSVIQLMNCRLSKCETPMSAKSHVSKT